MIDSCITIKCERMRERERIKVVMLFFCIFFVIPPNIFFCIFDSILRFCFCCLLAVYMMMMMRG